MGSASVLLTGEGAIRTTNSVLSRMLNINGSATLDGVLNLITTGYTPVLNDSFLIFTCLLSTCALDEMQTP